ncbi:putative importin-beta domain, armadillo-like helical, exportin-1/5, exportin-5 [Septoria linicola]|nr:putative importin-beta domain, armadillo-like helical, exportin-1/5, exportin-5 [Septoria linicola]
MAEGAFNAYWQQPDTALHLEHITNALDATLNPRVPNDVRQQALQHLEAVKSQPDAPQHGFTLADDWKQNDAVRYYGLQLLEFAVRYRWHEYSEDQAAQLRTWIKQLAGSLREQDAAFLRNKISQLWVEIAKRSWGGGEWMDMDALLINLWSQEKGAVNKVLVLAILEGLNDDIINNDDSVAGLRLDVLGDALVEIVVPPRFYETLQKEKIKNVRPEGEGWLFRISNFFSICVKEARMRQDQPDVARSMELCAVKSLNAMRSMMGWINFRAVEEVNCVDCLYLPFYTSNMALQMAAVEVLHTLLGRPQSSANSTDVWLSLIRQALHPDRVSIIRNAFEQTMAGPGDDDEKYTLQKKMAELLSVMADAIALNPAIVDQSLDLPALFDLLVLVLQHKSLTVSIPVLHSWTKLLNVHEDKIIDLTLAALPTLLDVCSDRLIRYEALPEDTDDETLRWLDEDFDTVPERHAFLGNYRRYSQTIVEGIARSRPIDALSIVLNQMRELVETGPYTAGRGFDSSTYTNSSYAVLRFDASYCTVAAALRGYASWTKDVSDIGPEQELYSKVQQDQQQASESLQQWCFGMTNIHTDDPGVADEVLQTLVAVLRVLKSPPQTFVLAMVQHLLTMRLYDQPTHAQFTDAIKSFEALRVVELQKLALAYPNVLLEVYNELEPRIEVLAQKHGDDQRLVWGYRSFLFMIVHRATGIDEQVRVARLEQMLKPTYDAWTDSALQASAESFQAFCATVGLGTIAEFYKQHEFDRTQDWSARTLNDTGQARQNEIKEKADRLPLRMTKSLLSATTERLRTGSVEYDNACALWGPLIPSILQPLLQMTRHAQAFHDMSNWSQLPPELQMVVRRTLQDRFWQSGISNESKEEFYARISGSKTSYEGFASTVRGTMRNVREMGYHVIYLMTKFEEQFYGIENLAGPLADALFDDAGSLSANHLHPLINLTTGLVQRCPPHYRARFLPPVLRKLFVCLDGKISADWEAISQAEQLNKKENDELSDEMRTESVLRQLTYSMVTFVPFLLEYDRQAQQMPNGHAHTNRHSPGTKTQNVSDLVLSDPSILEPLILFCTHALRMHDGRCCSTICKVFRSIIPLFTHTTQTASAISPEAAASVREFISTEVLKACITSLNEPYFADLQKDLATLIANIMVMYSSKTDTPRQVLLSLPDITEHRLEKAMAKMVRTSNERSQRSVVLDLLEGVRGVSIHEMGKVEQAKAKRKENKGVAAQYTMAAEATGVVRGGEDELDGVAGLFGDA